MKTSIIKKLLSFALLLLMLQTATAMDFNAGVYYFDNSKTGYGSVRFIAGSKANATTLVLEMDSIEGKPWWQFALSDTLTNVDFYAFIESDMPADTIMMSPRQFIDSLKADTLVNIRCTKLKASSDNVYNPDWVFCPTSDLPDCNGYWRTIDSYNTTITGTLPVIYITTEGHQPILTKTYLPGTYYIDNMGHEELPSVGSEAEPQVLEIKGRGNITWEAEIYPKKPYKLKLDKKTDLLGNGKNKHYVLLSEPDFLGFLKDPVGFELSRRMGLPFTPASQPVEVVLNDDFIGMYLLCEHVRVDKSRVNIIEQEDGDTIPENVTGGWLLEIDNHPEEGEILINQMNDSTLRVLLHTPEVLSTVQRDYITNLLMRTDSAVFASNPYSTRWSNFIDCEALARFYIIYEIVDNFESFSGSCFFYKERGDSTKFIFGPVWDFGSSFGRLNLSPRFIYQDPFHYAHIKWIKQISRFSNFKQMVTQVWNDFYPTQLTDIGDWLNNYATKIRTAAANDQQRWPQIFSAGSSVLWQASVMDNFMKTKTAWLDEQWHTYVSPGDVNGDGGVNVTDVTTLVNMILHVVPVDLGMGDLNGDGKVNVSDVTTLINVILGIH
ncbi:MAG: CotH kinase family protein [Muribaculaceae bacterium]|nr:CotH kinase family protein [Muribaculaceae bacterium]